MKKDEEIITDGCTLSGCSCGCASMFLLFAVIGIVATILISFGYITFV